MTRVTRLPWALRVQLVEEEIESRLAELRQLTGEKKPSDPDVTIAVCAETETSEPNGCVELRC